ncbi:protein TIC 40 chloroplastic [Tripterygium wilfordii]|uniref:Protein TIC 40, chloroplastic n=1 Tax=Tripterygium wilfordii TaxID=458696 RepID=A0A7J7DMB1_TRIWF|nr:protein TIC 40, chloroplastic-like [Tripterygium wilfordii]KAF5747467.1 protein TIC 40 chloroplastic [Tripterygium wilfordii]
METFNMALVSISSPKLVLGFTFMKNPTGEATNTRISPVGSRLSSVRGTGAVPRGYRISIAALAHSHRFRRSTAGTSRISQDVLRELNPESFASISSSSSQETSSIGVNPQRVPPPTSNMGSPLFWIGVGVGLSALFSLVATNLKKYAMQQAMKTMMGQMNTQNSPFNNAGFPSSSPFPFPMPPGSVPTTSPSPPASQPAITMDISATKVEPVPTTEVKEERKDEQGKDETRKDQTAAKKEQKNYGFVDVSPEETVQSSPFKIVENVDETTSSKDTQSGRENGAVSKQSGGAFEASQSTGSGLSVEALEKMMEDPTVQKMVYPYLPEEMRNPTTFKWMLQHPEYRKQLEDMLNNMGGSGEWDNRVMDTLKDFDLNSPEVKQQFDQIGLTPEEVISKILANPEVAMAFQNPRVQQAIMECSQNPMSITKYQNDKEVMDVFNKISELFPGMTGSP